jgi:hypothetical protein
MSQMGFRRIRLTTAHTESSKAIKVNLVVIVIQSSDYDHPEQAKQEPDTTGENDPHPYRHPVNDSPEVFLSQFVQERSGSDQTTEDQQDVTDAFHY